jgi:hypothetical protein
MKNKKNNNKLYYMFTDEELHSKSKDYLPQFIQGPSITSSCWFSSMPANVSKYLTGKNFKSTNKLMSYLAKKMSRGDTHAGDLFEYRSYSTIKVCPAVQEVLKTSHLILAPCDIHISIFKDGTWVSKVPDGRLLSILGDHPREQLTPLDTVHDLFKGRTVIKFKLPIIIGVDNDAPWIFLQPHYHNNIPIEVLNGVVSGKYSKDQELNIITLVDISKEENYTIDIKKGEVLAYLWSPTPLKLEKRDSLNGIVFRSKFTRGYTSYE